MIRILVFVVFMLPSVIYAQGEEDEKESFSERISFGGGGSVWFGTTSNVYIAPQVLYKVVDNLYTGVGLSYSYWHHAPSNSSLSFGGGNVFSRYYINDQIFLHIEAERIRGRFDQSRQSALNLENYYAGGGYSQSLGGAVSANIMVLYNFNYSEFSPFPNPLIRFGINAGLGF